MRRITMMQSQWRAQALEGEALELVSCKGGYFSTRDEYALRVLGKSSQSADGSSVRCVKLGTKISCANEITLPCDLYDGDVWLPASGRVIRASGAVEGYPSCNLYAPSGDSRVGSTPIELAPGLSATVLVRRT